MKNGITRQGDQFKHGGTGCIVKISPCYNNCKFGTIDQVNMSNNNAGVKIDLIKEALMYRSAMRVVMAHVTNEYTVNQLKKNFEVLSVVKIPIGYSGGFQWHVHIRNHNDRTYRTRIEKEGVVNELIKSSVSNEMLEKAFRAGRKDKSYHIKSGFKKFINKGK